ncbi:MAG: glycosyltransferase [Bacteroidota bacterium]
MTTGKNILVCPLNWGLGHATRCIPIINILKDNGHNVFIATCGDASLLLQSTFPDDLFICFDDYKIKFTKGNNLVEKLMWQLPKIILRIILEHYKLKRIIKQYHIQTIISDNRFGLWNRNINSIYITHQIHIKTPGNIVWKNKLIFKIHLFFIRKYNTCLIPDVDSRCRLAGDLSDNSLLQVPSQYIGILSRFKKSGIEYTEKYDLCIILSGPEPQRSIFQQKILEQIQNTELKVVLFLGITSKTFIDISNKNTCIYSNANQVDLSEFMAKSRFVLARSGYSTIMDLAATGKKAILIPTPGQTEQEYLAKYWFDKGVFYTQNQQNFNLKQALDKVNDFSGISISNSVGDLKQKILSVI